MGGHFHILSHKNDNMIPANLGQVPANLGQVPTFNRSRISAQLSCGLKSSVVQATTAAGCDVVEAVRVLNDACNVATDRLVYQNAHGLSAAET